MAEPGLIEVLQALADPVRLQIVPVPVSKSTISHHYKVLREAGIVQVRVEGTRRYHALRREDLDARFPGLLDAILCVGDDGEARTYA